MTAQSAAVWFSKMRAFAAAYASTLTSFSEADKAMTRTLLGTISSVCNVTFVEVECGPVGVSVGAGTGVLVGGCVAVAAGSGVGVVGLTGQQLQPVVDAAIARWAASGLDAAQLSTLRNTPIHIADFLDSGGRPNKYW